MELLDGTLGFHALSDAMLKYVAPPKSTGPTSHTELRHIVTIERALSYQFFAHYHPYATQLMSRLLTGSTKGLLAADTEYITALTLTAEATGTSGGSAVTIPVGERVTIVDGAEISLADGTRARSAGRHLVDDDDKVLIASAGASVTAPIGLAMVRAGGAKVVLDQPVAATLDDGGPRPSLWRQYFGAYLPDAALVPSSSATPHPTDDLDFSTSGAYAGYNWELFFHVPLTIAIHLSRNGRYEEARRWFHLIFDPTDDGVQIAPERYWKVKPFQTTEIRQIEEILVNLSTGADPALQRQTIDCIGAWKDAPFRPHAIARFRHSAYMWKTVMAYMDNDIAWGDSLLRQDTPEAVDEAVQIYVMPAMMLGPTPQVIPSKGRVRPQSYATLRGNLDAFGNAMRDIESSLLFDLGPPPPAASEDGKIATLRGLGRTLYFGVPRNDKLLGYWDTVGDRLFKIRNSLNIDGVFRRMPLFSPPIDPGLLARAVAAGIDPGAAAAGLSQPLPLVRFGLLAQKATELAQQVGALGNAMLSAIEREDNETLAVLRARHERVMATLAEEIKYGQLQEAVKAREGLLRSLSTTVLRYAHFERQLGTSMSDIKVPELDDLDLDDLAKFNLRAEEPEVALRDVPVDIAKNVVSDASGRILSSHEALELDKLVTARTISDVIKVAELAGQALAMLPDFGIKFHFWGLGGDTKFGGRQFADLSRFIGEVGRAATDRLNYEAGIAAKIGGYARREQEWAQQSNIAAAEISQIFKQLRAAQIREAVASKELHNHRRQIEHSSEIESYLNEEGDQRGKTANKALLTWLKRETRRLHTQFLDLAVDVARKAERALQAELGDPTLRFITGAYAAGKEGLLAGETLLLDIKRMELAYHEQNKREYELTKHVSLAQLNPHALMDLRAVGVCEVALPEEFFDFDSPGHYFRRLRSVSVSVPCVTGPYTNVSLKLTLLQSSIRRSAIDEDLETYHGSTQSIVASTANQDGGLFEPAPGDDRRRPFELAGAISNWRIELPAHKEKEFRLFDYDTISDVVMHLRYTAREGGETLRKKRVAAIEQLFTDAKYSGMVRMFSIRHEFPDEWARFKAAAAPASLTLTFRKGMFPYWGSARMKSIVSITGYRPADKFGDEPEQVIDPDAAVAPNFDTPWSVAVDQSVNDLWLFVKWSG